MLRAFTQTFFLDPKVSQPRRMPSTILVMILVLSFFLRVYRLDYNSPFTDEAQYIVLGRAVLAGHWQEEQPFSWVGGMPLFYPPLAALFGTFGIVGARFLNVLLGTASVSLIYLFGKQLRLSKQHRENEIVGLMSALLLGTLAIPVHLSRLATYDMLSFTLFLAGLVFLQKAFLVRPGPMAMENRFFLSAVFLFLSFLAKYVILPFLPLLILFAMYMSVYRTHTAFHLTLKYFVFTLILGTLGYILIKFPELRQFASNQIRDPQPHAKEIINQFVVYTLPVYGLAFLGTVPLIFRKKAFIPLALIAASLFVVVLHLVQNSSSSVYQHTFLSLVFLLPLAGYWFAQIISITRRPGALAAAAILLFLSVHSMQLLRGLEAGWQNSDRLMDYLRASVGTQSLILAQENDVVVLGLPEFDDGQVIGPFAFDYQGLSSLDAYSQATRDGYFDFLQLTVDADAEFNTAVASSMGDRYEMVFDEYPFEVYRKL